MKTNEIIYKGVPLTNGRTTELIDAIIENRNRMNAKELAELIGFDSYRPLVGIFRYLNKETPKPKAVVKLPKMAKNTFSNYHGSGKEVARDLIAESIMLTNIRSSNILTLPADTWIMEKNILKKKSGYKFTAVERDRETFQRMVKNLTSNNELFDSIIGMENKSIGEVIVNNGEDTYSSAILDYCGFIDSFYDEIKDVMKRNLIKKGGYITLTLAENDRVLNHSHHTTSYSNTYIKNCCVDEEINGAKVTNDLVNILVYNHSGYKIVNKYSYRDKKVNMLLFIIKRIDE